MKKQPAIVFDLGRVLVDFDYGLVVSRLALRCGRPAAAIARLVDQSPLLIDYESGLINTAEFFDKIRTATGFPGEIAEFAELFGDIFTEIEPLVAMQQQLKANGFKTYIFSNTNELAVRWITQRFPFFSGFTGYIYSYEHKAQKPEAKIYEVVESVTGRRGAQIVYIDDRAENIAAGQARGWQAVLQENPEKTRAQMAALTGLKMK